MGVNEREFLGHIMPAEKSEVQSTAPKRRVVSGKRYLDNKRFITRLNRQLKAKGEPRYRGKNPIGKNKKEEVKPKTRFPKSYVTQQGKSKLRLRKTKCFSDHVRRIRPSLVPGTVLILLAGPHKGKRVVYLKALSSGLLMVTGPFKYNGVPLRRVNQRYVIATNTKVDVSGVQLPEQLTDEFFRRVDLKKSDSEAKDFLSEEKQKYTVTDDRKTIQKTVDAKLCAAMKKHSDSKILRRYLKSLFSLGKRDYPHRMVF